MVKGWASAVAQPCMCCLPYAGMPPADFEMPDSIWVAEFAVKMEEAASGCRGLQLMAALRTSTLTFITLLALLSDIEL